MSYKDNPKKILLICYSYPPFQGIGGRRWAKFSKYLANAGFEIFVIGALNKNKSESNWIQDVSGNENIHYFPVKTKFYNFFHNHRGSFVGKLSFKLTSIWLRLFYRGNYFDKALPSLNVFYTKAKELIEENNISNLVITIAPNRLVEIGIKLKQEFPDLNFILDIRDPWNICNDDWDQKYLSKRRKKIETALEKKAVIYSNYVFSVCEIVTNYYHSFVKENKERILTVPNGFDSDDLTLSEKNSIEFIPNTFQIVFTGTLYDNVTLLFEEFILSLVRLEKESPELIAGIVFNFYIPEMKVFEKIVNAHGCNCVRFLEQIPLAKVSAIIENSAACMLFLPPKYEFSLSTKFFEYVSRNKKILLFSGPGEVPDLVKKHNLGYVIQANSMCIDLASSIKSLKENNEKPHTFNLEDYSVKNITKKLIPNFI